MHLKVKCEFCLTLRNVKPGSMLGATESQIRYMRRKLILGGSRERFMKPIFITARFKRDRSGRSMFIYTSEANRLGIHTLRSSLGMALDEKISSEHWDLTLGRFLGYPECCIEQYARDCGTKKSARRYFDQVKERKMNDPFGIELLERGVRIKSFISHIPCSPLCRSTEALMNRYVDSCPMSHGQMCLLKDIFRAQP